MPTSPSVGTSLSLHSIHTSVAVGPYARPQMLEGVGAILEPEGEDDG
jgi:hypothetical protein